MPFLSHEPSRDINLKMAVKQILWDLHPEGIEDWSLYDGSVIYIDNDTMGSQRLEIEKKYGRANVGFGTARGIVIGSDCYVLNLKYDETDFSGRPIYNRIELSPVEQRLRPLRFGEGAAVKVRRLRSQDKIDLEAHVLDNLRAKLEKVTLNLGGRLVTLPLKKLKSEPGKISYS